MRSLLAGACLFAAALLPTQAFTATFSIPDAGVSFDAPQGFTKLTPQEIAVKYPAGEPPSFAVGNVGRATSIAFDLKPYSLPPDRLQEAKAALEEVLGRSIPGIEWRERKLIHMQGRQWIYFEMTSRAVNADIYNIMLVTSLHGRMLIFNFNSTRNEFSRMEAELRRSIQTISLPRGQP